MSFSVAAWVMMTGIYGAVSLWRKGKAPSLRHPIHWPSVVRAVVWEVIGGRRIWRQSRLRWAIFFSISITFIALFVIFLIMVVTRYVYPTPFFTTGIGAGVLDVLADLCGLMIFVGTLLALYRRYVRKEPHLVLESGDVIVLWLLVGIIASGFFLEACRLAVVPHTGRTYASFVGLGGARILRSIDVAWTGVRLYVWLFHAVLAFVFLAYMPFSKLFHVIACPVSIVASASEAAYKQHQ